MNPIVLRILMFLSGAVCLAAAYFVRDQAGVLIPAGLGLLGWASPAPGHNKSGPTSPGVALLFASSLALVADVACSAAPPLPPAERARLGLELVRESCGACLSAGDCGDDTLEAFCRQIVEPVAVGPAPVDGGGGP